MSVTSEDPAAAMAIRPFHIDVCQERIDTEIDGPAVGPAPIRSREVRAGFTSLQPAGATTNTGGRHE